MLMTIQLKALSHYCCKLHKTGIKHTESEIESGAMVVGSTDPHRYNGTRLKLADTDTRHCVASATGRDAMPREVT